MSDAGPFHPATLPGVSALLPRHSLPQGHPPPPVSSCTQALSFPSVPLVCMSRGQACAAHTMGLGLLPPALGTGASVLRPAALGTLTCVRLWGAALSPGRARGRCISATLRGSPSSWPLSLRLGSKGQGSVGRACPEPQPPTPSGNPLLLKSQRQLRCISGAPGWSTYPQPPAPSTERGMEASSGPASAGRRSHRCLPRATAPISQLVLRAGQGNTAAGW